MKFHVTRNIVCEFLKMSWMPVESDPGILFVDAYQFHTQLHATVCCWYSDTVHGGMENVLFSVTWLHAYILFQFFGVKIQNGFTLTIVADPSSPGKEAVKRMFLPPYVSSGEGFVVLDCGISSERQMFHRRGTNNLVIFVVMLLYSNNNNSKQQQK